MKSMGKLHLLIDKLDRLGCKIAGLTEVRWPGRGYFTTKNNHTVHFSGYEKEGLAGVACILNRDVTKAFLRYYPLNERLMSIRIQCKPFNVMIIVNYSPTSDAKDEVIKEHYNNLQSLIDYMPKNDILLIVGDFNVKVGDHSFIKEVMGNKGLGSPNDRGFQLVDFCHVNHLTILNMWFDQHSRRKYTWTAPTALPGM